VSEQRNGGETPSNIATAVTEISERASILVREEIELAKAELTEKGTRIAKGAVVGAVAGVFFVCALLFVLIGLAWLLYFYLPVGQFAFFWGFFAMGLILVVLGVAAGLIAARALKRGSPPVPTMAIEEAQKIRETVVPTHDAPRPSAPSATPPWPTAPVPAAAPVAPVVAEPAPAPIPEPPAPPENGAAA
jgi:uncharacterized small protein (DUF1192 family)